MGRPPIGKAAMTGAERIKRWRSLHKPSGAVKRELARAKARVAELTRELKAKARRRART
jgi:hypothetical protein